MAVQRKRLLLEERRLVSRLFQQRDMAGFSRFLESGNPQMVKVGAHNLSRLAVMQVESAKPTASRREVEAHLTALEKTLLTSRQGKRQLPGIVQKTLVHSISRFLMLREKLSSPAYAKARE